MFCIVEEVEVWFGDIMSNFIEMLGFMVEDCQGLNGLGVFVFELGQGVFVDGVDWFIGVWIDFLVN